MYKASIQTAIDYIEDNLATDFTLQDIGDHVGFSIYHFHRVFKATVGESLSQYIRKRRLTLAAKELIGTDKRIVDIALDSYFDTPESFSRAFRKMFRVSPREYRQRRTPAVFQEKPRLDRGAIQHLIGGLTLEPKIVTKDEFTIIGLKYHGNNQNGEIPAMWGELFPRVGEIANRKNGASLGLCEFVPNMTSESKFSYIAGVEVEKGTSVPPGMVTKTVPVGKYAVFTHKGPIANLETTYNFIYGTWIHNTDQVIAERDDFELYDERFLGPDHPDSQMDIYVPIK